MLRNSVCHLPSRFLVSARRSLATTRTLPTSTESSSHQQSISSTGSLHWVGAAGLLTLLSYHTSSRKSNKECSKCHGASISSSEQRQQWMASLKSSFVGIDEQQLPEYTLEQVAQRNGIHSSHIWMSYGGFVYDVTDFIPLHPGGTDRISRAAGAAIEPFWYLHQQHFDTQEPVEILKKLVVGRLAESDQRVVDDKLETLQEELESFHLELDVSKLDKNNSPTPTKLSLNDLKALPKTDRKSQVGCPNQNQNRRPVSVSLFGGVQLKHILAASTKHTRVGRIVFHAMDGEQYTLEITGDTKESYQDILVCYEMDGLPLTKSRGFPLRVIIPGKRAVKWVEKIEVHPPSR
ncbi:Sulfite oxidase, mitochondrial [Seminavis robusta]|uniref:Sulfite oxidase, mitochondrial n=1 Tax=Seminavis robusta TaxID=568900 RepID=A0A9N8E2Y1_9STRA|nr:Sulfite oxidase, mitochondrial [Seminavis robusta]|eukprot:Sro490_g153450.1 Sulfite oxidase, mitochondrial (349) ;mRNA; r:6283-7329